MLKIEKSGIDECERFLEALELVRLNGDELVEGTELLTRMPGETRRHAGVCESCAEALDDFVATRSLLVTGANGLGVVEPGPWFASKVMRAIAGKEDEIEQSDGVWQSVMKLAPRLAAVCALVLVLAGTWAVETRRQTAGGQLGQPGESLFEPSPSATLDDDVLASVEAHR
jgi:hypothetical protein